MADDEGKKSGKMKWIIIIVVLLALLGGGGFAAWKFFLAPQDEAASAAQTGTEAGADGEAMEDSGGGNEESVMITLPTFLVNLADPLGRRYIKLTVDVEVVNAKAQEEMKKREPKVRDSVILLLSSKSYNDLASMENKILLKDEIVRRLNQIMGGPRVLQVYFTELVIQ